MTTSLTNSDQSAKSSWALLPWKTRIMLALLSKLTDATRRPNGTVNRRLLSFFDFRSAATPSAPYKGVTTSDVTVDPSRDLWYRLFVPSITTTSSLPLVVFFHGGGFSFLSPDCFAYDNVCRRFARKIPAVVVSVNYRLSPEHGCPCQYDDGFDVLKFLDRNNDAAALPAAADLSKIFLAGDSAGANLAHQVALRACRERDQFSKAKAVGLISIQPFFGGEERTESEIRLEGAPLVSVTRTDWLWKAFLPVGSTRDHEVSNVSGPNAAKDISELEYPATVVVVGGLDPLQDWQRRYYEWLRKSGKEANLIEYPNMVHTFYIFPELPESNQLISQVKDFVAALL